MRAAVALLVGLALVPPAQATATCEDVTEQPPSLTGLYLVLDPPRNEEVWAESNGVPGLQRQACQTPSGQVVGRDTQLLEATR